MSDLSSAGSPPASPGSERAEATRQVQLNESDDSDEDVTTARNPRKHAAPVDDEELSDVPMGEGDLFGDDSDSESKKSPKRRKLSDSELDSGDDVDRRDRVEDNMEVEEEEPQQESLKIIDYDLDRHGIPQCSDGEFYLLRFPQSMGIDPTHFIPGQFEKPTKAHHGAPPSSAFSAAQVANSTIRWRRNPNDPAKLQSNARILRWSDGSLTIQIASMPFDQFELPAKALAPPQSHPKKPTPISDPKKPVKYDPRADSHTYLTSIHPSENLVQITNHITASLTVETTGDEEDEALIRLQEQLSAAAKGSKGEGGRGPEIVTLTEDPELARKRAEAAERDRARADRRRLNQQEKERDRAARVLGRPSGTGRSGGLTIGGLEDDDGATDTRRRPKPQRKPRRRNSEYSEDEDEGGYGRRGGKEDEYDKDDGFLVESDEEIEAEDDDSEEDEFGDGDADAEGDEDEDDAKPAAKEKPAPAPASSAREDGGRTGRRRRVVDDDEDDE